MLENAAESHTSGARCVGTLLILKYALPFYKHILSAATSFLKVRRICLVVFFQQNLKLSYALAFTPFLELVFHVKKNVGFYPKRNYFGAFIFICQMLQKRSGSGVPDITIAFSLLKTPLSELENFRQNFLIVCFNIFVNIFFKPEKYLINIHMRFLKGVQT